jgi:alkanesulfonate monooxygenase SsuD/methylene tetrahydromethanopterin reductase-like flavin-dependent oxidoreductase (luciferase family)
VEIGIGIPNSVVGTSGRQLLDWARRADQVGFSSLASIGAVSYPNYEELTVLAAAGAVTQRIRLVSNVLIAPARNVAELAKQAATVQQITDGRLTLGLGVGWRESDYTLTGRNFHTRGREFDAQLSALQHAWQGQPLVIGGMTDATIRRVVEHGVGWTASGLPPDALAPFIEKVRKAWRDARQGEPRLVGLVYFSLGQTEIESRGSLLDYYKPMGAEMAEIIAGSALRSPTAIREAVKAYEDVGLDELILDPTVSDPKQVDLLAEVVL